MDGKRVFETRRVSAPKELIRDNGKNTNWKLKIRGPMFITITDRKIRPILKLRWCKYGSCRYAYNTQGGVSFYNI